MRPRDKNKKDNDNDKNKKDNDNKVGRNYIKETEINNNAARHNKHLELIKVIKESIRLADERIRLADNVLKSSELDGIKSELDVNKMEINALIGMAVKEDNTPNGTSDYIAEFEAYNNALKAYNDALEEYIKKAYIATNAQSGNTADINPGPSPAEAGAKQRNSSVNSNTVPGNQQAKTPPLNNSRFGEHRRASLSEPKRLPVEEVRKEINQQRKSSQQDANNIMGGHRNRNGGSDSTPRNRGGS